MFTQIITMLTLILTLNGASVEVHDTYMRAMVVTDVNYETDIVTCVDAVGFEWQFYGCEDYFEGDLVCTLMDDMGTKETILDDIIIDTNYSGYWMG